MRRNRIEQVPSLRILMLGDKGVGKTSVTKLLEGIMAEPSNSFTFSSQHLNIIEERLHKYHCSRRNWVTPTCPGGDMTFPYNVEFIDIPRERRLTRIQSRRLLQTIDGIVLVYNLQDTSSHDYLNELLYEPLCTICGLRHRRPRWMQGRKHVPMLVVGTGLDQLTGLPLHRSGSIAFQVSAEEILVNSQDPISMTVKGQSLMKLHHFLNRAVEFKLRFPIDQIPRFF